MLRVRSRDYCDRNNLRARKIRFRPLSTAMRTFSSYLVIETSQRHLSRVSIRLVEISISSMSRVFVRNTRKILCLCHSRLMGGGEILFSIFARESLLLSIFGFCFKCVCRECSCQCGGSGNAEMKIIHARFCNRCMRAFQPAHGLTSGKLLPK